MPRECGGGSHFAQRGAVPHGKSEPKQPALSATASANREVFFSSCNLRVAEFRLPLSYPRSTRNSGAELGEVPTTRSDDGPSTARRGAALLGPERVASNEQGILDF